jgi:1,4-dihydroxy-2-naphthoate octaprenyltransferase
MTGVPLRQTLDREAVVLLLKAAGHGNAKVTAIKFNDDGGTRLRRVALVIRAVRPWSFSMTAVSVALGTLAAGGAGRIDWWLALAALAGTLCLHAATNLGNDYFDFQSGIDTAGTPSVLARRHPLVERTLEPLHVLAGAVGFWSAAVLIGFALSVLRGWVPGLLTVIGVLGGFFYSAGPLRLKGRALGELTAFIMWGPLMVLGAFYVQRATFSGSRHALLLSVMQGLWVALVLLANNLRDVEADAALGIRTPATLLGKKRAVALAAALAAGAYLLDAAAVGMGALQPWALLVFLSAPLSVMLLRSFSSRRGVAGSAPAAAARAALVFGSLLVLSLVLGGAAQG